MNNIQNNKIFNVYCIKENIMWKKIETEVCYCLDVTLQPRHLQVILTQAYALGGGGREGRQDKTRRVITSSHHNNSTWLTHWCLLFGGVTFHKSSTAIKKPISKKPAPRVVWLSKATQRGSQCGVTVRSNLSKEKKHWKLQTRGRIGSADTTTTTTTFFCFTFWH